METFAIDKTEILYSGYAITNIGNINGSSTSSNTSYITYKSTSCGYNTSDTEITYSNLTNVNLGDGRNASDVDRINISVSNICYRNSTNTSSNDVYCCDWTRYCYCTTNEYCVITMNIVVGVYGTESSDTRDLHVASEELTNILTTNNIEVTIQPEV